MPSSLSYLTVFPGGSPMAMWTESTGWVTVRAQMCRLCKASTPSTESSRSRTAVKSTPFGVPGNSKDKGYRKLLPPSRAEGTLLLKCHIFREDPVGEQSWYCSL